MSEHFEQDPKKVESLRMQVDSLIQNYLNQKPTPGIADFAEAFGAEAYVTEMKRQKAVTVNIKAFREEIVERLLTQAEVTGIDVVLPKVFEMLPQTILPPDEGEIKTGSGEGIEKKRFIPRTQYLIELLSEIGEQYEIIGGKNTSDMMRERTYFIFHLPNSEKALFVNNEEGNTTFIIYQVNSRQESIDLAALTKDEIRAQELHDHPFAQIDWTGDEDIWKAKLLKCLTGSVPENGKVDKEQEELAGENLDQENHSNKRGPRRKDTTRWTTESAISTFEQAHSIWSAQDEKTRTRFHARWLLENGFIGLTRWAYRNGGMESLAAKASEAVKKDFEKAVIKQSTESIMARLKEAYEAWKIQDPNTRGKFNQKWLRNNGFNSINSWTITKGGGMKDFIKKAPEDLQRDFEIGIRYDLTSALTAFEKAHTVWQSEDEASRGTFNPTWLTKKGFQSVYDWAKEHGGISKFLGQTSEQVQRDFKKMEISENFTLQTAFIKLEECYEKWKSQAPESRGKFNQTWLLENGFSGLVGWFHRRGGLETFIPQVSEEIQKDFSYRKHKKRKKIDTEIL